MLAKSFTPKPRAVPGRRRRSPMTLLGLGVGGMFTAIVILTILMSAFGGDLRPVPTAPPTAPPATWATLTRAAGRARPVWWTVRAERNGEARLVYRVDQPEVKTTIEAHVRDALRFVSYQAGPPDLSQADLYLTPERLLAVAAARAAAVAKGEYWRLPIVQAIHWQGEPEFSADASEVMWSFLVDEDQIDQEHLFYERVVNGVVTLRLRMTPTLYVLLCRYDPQLGRWREVQAVSQRAGGS